MCCLKGVAVLSLSLFFRFVEFCSVPCHPRDMKQQNFILLEIRGLSRNSWRRMRKGLSVLAWKLFTSHLNLRLNYIEPDKDVWVYSGQSPGNLWIFFACISLETMLWTLYPEESISRWFQTDEFCDARDFLFPDCSIVGFLPSCLWLGGCGFCGWTSSEVEWV